MSSGKLLVRIGERFREVSFQRRSEQVTAAVDGRSYCLSIHEARPGVYSFVPADEGGRSTEAIVVEAPGGAWRVRIRDRVFEAFVEKPGRPDGFRASGGMEGRMALRAVMPGRIVRVLVEPGAEVRRGQGIVVIEAMKMENEIGSPKDGVVRELRAAPGDRVESGATLAVIE